ncbi:MAG: hypothetical protein WC455_29920, partial [Dehalococcoidia bacterium]
MAKIKQKTRSQINITRSSVHTPEQLANKLSALKPGQKAYTGEQLAAADKATNDKKTKSTGITATRMWGDVFNEEYLSELKGTAGAIVFENMLRSDYQVGLLEESITGIIKAAHFSFSVPDVKNGDKHAELCTWQWEHGFDKEVDENLNDLCSHIFFGNAVFEPVDYEAYKHPKYGLINRLKTMGFRDQTSITGWRIEGSKLIAVHQQTYYSTPMHDTWMPGENLMVLSEKRKGDNYEGRAMLRKAYGPYWRKNVYYKLLSIGLEKAALGLIVVTVPPGKVGTDEEEAFLDAVSNYVAHENAYLKKTGAYTNDKFEGFEVEIVAIDFKADAVINAIKLEDTNIAKCGAAAFSELGQGGNGGAYNLGVADIDFFFSMVTGRLRYICQKTSRIWKDLIVWNYGEQPEYPVLKGELESKAGEEFARTLNYFYNMGLYTPQPEDEEYIRKKYNMPELKVMADSDPAKKKAPAPELPPDDKKPATDDGEDPVDAEDDAEDAGEADENKPPKGKAAKKTDAGKGKMSLSKQEPKYIKTVTGKI